MKAMFAKTVELTKQKPIRKNDAKCQKNTKNRETGYQGTFNTLRYYNEPSDISDERLN